MKYLLTYLLIIAPLLALNAQSNQKNTSKPNFIVIMVDDMGYSDIGCFGGEVNTPTLDRLAKDGLRFRQFYNASRCCPSRASLLTGLYPHQAGIGDMVHDKGTPEYQGYLNKQSMTMAEVLKTAGYQTLMSGKWHVGETKEYWPLQRGFDQYFGLISGAANYYNLNKGKSNRPRRQIALQNEPYEPTDGFYMTTAITDYALEFLEESPKDRPFFMYLAYTAPHWPLHALQEDIDKYTGKYTMGWDALRNQRFERMVEMGIIPQKTALPDREAMIPAWSDIKRQKEMDQKMAVYAAQIDRVDQGIAKILKQLEASGEAENTWIFFLSDNGACHEGGIFGMDDFKNGVPPGSEDSYMSYGRAWANASNTPYQYYKHWTHEGGIITPFIAYHPSQIRNKGAITNEVGVIRDIMATLVDLSGATYPETFQGERITPLEGKSLAPVFAGKKIKRDAPLFWEHEGNRAVREGDWKLVSAFENKRKKHGNWELYNLKKDPTEETNLATKYPNKVADLEKKYIQWAEFVKVVDYTKFARK